MTHAHTCSGVQCAYIRYARCCGSVIVFIVQLFSSSLKCISVLQLSQQGSFEFRVYYTLSYDIRASVRLIAIVVEIMQTQALAN